MNLSLIFTFCTYLVIGLLASAAHASGQAVPEVADKIPLQIRATRALIEQGKIKQALAEITTLQKAAMTKEGPKYRGEILNIAGVVRLASGSLAEADRAFKEAIRVAARSNDVMLLGKVLNNRAILQLQQNNPRQALPLIEKGLVATGRSGDTECAGKLHIAYANALLDVGDNDQAERQMALAHQKLLALPLSKSRSKGLTVVGDWYLETATAVADGTAKTLFDKAKSAYSDALESAEQQGDAGISSYASGNLGRAEELAGELGDALRHTRAAMFYAQGNLDSSQLLYLWQWQGARILKAQGLQDEAIALNRLAVQTLQAHKPSFTSSNFDTEIKPVYLDLADMLLNKASTMPPGKEAQDTLREVLRTIGLLRSDELKDYLRDACVPVSRPGDLRQVLAGKRLALVHYLVLGERVEALVESAAGISRFTVAAPVSEISDDAWLFRRLIQDRDEDYMEVGRKLYDLLVRPLDPVIAGSSTLVILPDGVIRTIPIAALHDGANFLIEKHVVTMAQVDVVTGASGLNPGRKMLLGGISRKVPGYRQIASVDQELDDIHNLSGGTVVKNESFTVPSLTRRIKEGPYQVLHIASHGIFADDIFESYILAWDGKLRMDELGNIAGSSRYNKAPLDLLVLSACSTAAGDERASLGLAGVAVKAGAGSVIGSLWDVDDKATARFFSSFYRIMKESPSLSKAEALRQAQLQMLHRPATGAAALAGVGVEQGQPLDSYAAPYYWAPFVLVTGSI